VTQEDDSDSLLRAIAAAPAATPMRTLTAMVVRASADVPVADQWSLVRECVADRGTEVEEPSEGVLVVVWAGADHAERAAACALELRSALPTLAIALATGGISPGTPTTPLVERAIGHLDPTGKAICIDAETAARVDERFSVQRRSGAPIVLVEPLTAGTPARLEQTVGNYKIVRLLGTGGMGVVYVAEHLTLGRKAVVKFVHDRLSQTDEFSARFFSEAKLAASIHHPGIVDVFDYGHDERGRGYIVMEYLDGESLRARLRRESPLPVDLAVTLASQIASALGAAHDAGVIHRDLKPDNIFLVRDPDSAHRARAKVLDFGLAKLAQATDRGLTQSGDFVGTPLYMSPEQCRSKQLDARTDVYSLGCVLFEMVCGRPPFVDDTVGDLIIAHTSKPPPSPSTLVATVPAALERTILRALAKLPDERHPDMAALGADLAALDVTAVAKLPRPIAKVRPRRRVVFAAGGTALALAAIAGIVTWSRAHSHPAVTSLAPGAHRSVAVVDPRDDSGGTEAAWLGTALGEIVTTDLLSAGPLTVAATTDVARMKQDLGIGDAEKWSATQLDKARTNLGVDYVIAGSYRATGDEVRLDVQILDTASGQSVGKASASGAVSDLGGIGSRLATDIEHVLGVQADPAATPTATVLPSRPAAARLYAEGLARLRRDEITPARDLLQRAATDDPDDPLIHAALAETWRSQGYDAKAAAEIGLASAHSSQLPKESKLAIEAAYRESLQQWDQAIDAYRTLVDFYPARLDYGLALAAAQTRAGDAKSAYATIDAFRKQPQLASDPRIEVAEADAAEAADDTERERVHAERGVALARARGARGLLAKALFRFGWASWVLGRDADAKAAYDEARQIFIDLRDRSGLARCLNNIGLAAHRDRRDDAASKAFDQGLRLATQIGDTTAQAWLLQNWGFMLIDQGELPHALELANQKLELGGARGDSPASQAAAHANIAEILRLQGDLAGAKTHAKVADDLLRGVDERLFAAFNNDQLGEIARAEDDLVTARKLLLQGVQWASQAKHLAFSAECRMSLARTELDANDPSDAETYARDALADLREAKDPRLQACAVALVSTALLASGRASEAAKELAAAAPVADATLACGLDLDVARARALEDPARRLAAIHEVADRAGKHGLVQRELEIRLAAGDDRKALARDAAAKGFKQIARRARE
jgi:tRNA A-37 threonylcarbamoyl transferase component Bud32/TolB-like protein/Tfp pilus assembly protein PilF